MPNMRTIGYQLLGMGVAVLITYLVVEHFVVSGEITMSQRFTPTEIRQRILALTGLISLFTGPLGIVLATIVSGRHFQSSSTYRELPPLPTRVETLEQDSTVESEEVDLRFQFAPYKLLYRRHFPLRMSLALFLFVPLLVANFSQGKVLYAALVVEFGLLVVLWVLSHKTVSFHVDNKSQRLMNSLGRVVSPGHSPTAKFAAVVGLPVESWVRNGIWRRRIHQVEICVVSRSGSIFTLGLEERTSELEEDLYRLAQVLEVPCYLGPRQTKCKIERTARGIRFLARPNPMMVWESATVHQVRPR